MSLIHKLLVTLGIRKKSPPDTFVLASIDLVDDGLGNMVTPAVIRRRGNRVFVGTGKLYLGGKQVPPVPMPSAAPPMRKRLDPQPTNQVVDPTAPLMYNPISGGVFQPSGIVSSMYQFPVEPSRHEEDSIQAKGGEFSGAGASGSWDSPSSCSSDTSSSSSDSGSSSCGSD